MHHVALLILSLPGALYLLVFAPLDVLYIIPAHLVVSWLDLVSCGRLLHEPPPPLPLQHLVEIVARTSVREVPPCQGATHEAKPRYVAPDSVWEALRGPFGSEPKERDVRLLRLSWLLQLGTPGTSVNLAYGGVLPRRQEVPEEAFIDVNALES